MPTRSERERTPLPGGDRPGVLASFVRFAVCGGGVGIASSAAVAALAERVPWALANAVVTAVSTVLATELHARISFGMGRHTTVRQHLQSAGSAAAAYATTSAAMFTLHLVVVSPGAVCEQLVYLTASGLAGIGRFAVLRFLVFRPGPDAPPVRAAPDGNEVLVPRLAPPVPAGRH